MGIDFLLSAVGPTRRVGTVNSGYSHRHIALPDTHTHSGGMSEKYQYARSLYATAEESARGSEAPSGMEQTRRVEFGVCRREFSS